MILICNSMLVFLCKRQAELGATSIFYNNKGITRHAIFRPFFHTA